VYGAKACITGIVHDDVLSVLTEKIGISYPTIIKGSYSFRISHNLKN
jgi:hypothetical protein